MTVDEAFSEGHRRAMEFNTRPGVTRAQAIENFKAVHRWMREQFSEVEINRAAVKFLKRK